MLLPLTSCCWMTASDVTDACRVLEPISWSSQDTPETIRQIKVHNAKLMALCGKQ